MPSWPALSFEEVPWRTTESASLSRTQRLRQAGPYNAAITPPIAGVNGVSLPVSTLALVDDASNEIVRFDAESGSRLAPFSALLLRSESVASSRIENLTASAKAVLLAELGDTSRHNLPLCNSSLHSGGLASAFGSQRLARPLRCSSSCGPLGPEAPIIVANTRAMEAAVALGSEPDASTILAMHAALLERSSPEWAGKWRSEQVWIGGNNYSPHGAAFVPPIAERVLGAIDDLVEFIRRSDLPVLVHAAVVHAQFETIHPFPDGNGRVGRALLHSLLRTKGLTRHTTVPISAGLLHDTDAYFATLDAYRTGDPVPIVEGIANATFAAITNARRLVDRLTEVKAEWDALISVRRGAAAWKVAELLLQRPVVDSPLLQRELGVAAANANTAIDHLQDIGVLHQVAGQYRNRKWAALDVLDALDDFARRAMRG
jgi:Fic family protein